MGNVEPHLLLTVIFHPRPSLIGASAIVPRRLQRNPFRVGRYSPDFDVPRVKVKKPLASPYVSRHALTVFFKGETLQVHRAEGACRCRIGGQEMEGPLAIASEQLKAGVPIQLAHDIVLLLRFTSASPQPGNDLKGLEGHSAYMQDLRARVEQVARSDHDVLVLGETGTGKELVAEAIHQGSARSGAPLITVNMAAIPPSLAAAELFGAVKGAYTGATGDKEGYFRSAQSGCLFLDEVGDTPAEIQPQLLRAIQQREVQVVGGATEHPDIRVISATDAAVEDSDSGFKAALRHRLGALEVHLAALREHPEDIGTLAIFFFSQALAKEGREGLIPDVETDAREVAAWARLFYDFLCYHWPGNIRQLRNVCQQLVVASETCLVVPDNIQVTLSEHTQSSVALSSAEAQSRRQMDEVSAQEFAVAMYANNHEAAATARDLGVSRQAVYRRIEATVEYRLAQDLAEEEVQRVIKEHCGDECAAALAMKVSLSGLRVRLRNNKSRS